MTQSSQKTILITGAAKRMGAGLVQAFLAANWRVILHYNHAAKEAKALQGAAQTAGNHLIISQFDLTDSKGISAYIDDLVTTYQIDGIINNASHFSYDTPDKINLQSFSQSMAVNLLAPCLIGEAFYKQLIQNERYGFMVNILDAKLSALNPDYYSYTLSKAGLASATNMMAMSFAPFMRVNAIAPSVTLISEKQTPENFALTHKLNLLEKGVDVADIANAALYLATAPVITGQILTLDGGLSLMGIKRDVAFIDDDPKITKN